MELFSDRVLLQLDDTDKNDVITVNVVVAFSDEIGAIAIDVESVIHRGCENECDDCKPFQPSISRRRLALETVKGGAKSGRVVRRALDIIDSYFSALVSMASSVRARRARMPQAVEEGRS